MKKTYTELSKGYALYGFYGDNFKSHEIYRTPEQAERHRRVLQIIEHQSIIVVELVRNENSYIPIKI